MTDAIRDANRVPVALGVSSADATVTLPFKIDSASGKLLVDATGGGGSGTVTSITAGTGLTATATNPITTTGTIALDSKLAPLDTLGSALQSVRVNAGATALEYFTLSSGTVTTVSVVSANGFAGTVATATTTPAITLTTSVNAPILAGNGTAIAAATTTGSGSTAVLATGPTMTNPVVGTQSTGDNTTKAASTAFVTTAVNNAISGVNPAIAVLVATTAAGDTSALTYNNGVSGVGATLTGSNNTALTFDGVTLTSVNQRVLVKNDTQSPSGAFNGIYFLTQLQTGILPPILTRALDYNTPSNINSTGAIPVISGTANADTSWILTSTVTTVGTDALTYVQFTLNPTTIVVGPASATDGVPALFNGTTGKLIKNSTPTGSGNPVMQTSPTLTTPVIGVATGTSLVLTNTSATGFAVGAAGATNPVVAIDSSTASQADGILISGKAAGTGTTITAISSGSNAGITISSIGSGNAQLNSTSTSGNVNLQIASATKLTVNSSQVVVTDTQFIHNIQVAAGSSPRHSIAGAADTTLTAGTENLNTYFNFGQTRTFASNTIVALQRAARITGSTYAFATSGGVITDAATLAVDGPQGAGTNATITNSHGIYMPTTAVAGTVTNAYGLTVVAPSGGATLNVAAQFTGSVFLRDGTDATKILLFSASSITTGTTRTLTAPDASGVIVLDTATQTLTNKTFTSPVINTPTITVLDTAFTLEDDGDVSKKMVFQLSGITTATTRTITVPDASGTLTLNGAVQTISGAKTFNNATLIMAGSSSGTTTLEAAATASGIITFPAATDTVVLLTATQTLTNKRVTRRIVTVNAPGATPTTNTDNDNIAEFTGLGTAITSMTTNLSGTPVNGDELEFRFLDDGTGRAITWGASFANGGLVNLPTTTVSSTMLRVYVEYQTTASLNKWVCVQVS